MSNNPASKKPRYGYLSSRMIVECHPGDGQEPLHLFRWWKRIFELLDPPHYDPKTHTDRIHLRCLCNMFNYPSVDKQHINELKALKWMLPCICPW